MKKKLLALVLTVAVAAAMVLAACGGGGTPSGSGSAAPQGGSSAGIVLKLATTLSKNEFGGQMVEYLKGKVEELSGGEMTIDPSYSGTEVGFGEELSFVGAGAYDMTLIGQAMYTNVLPLLNFPSQSLKGYEDAVNLMDTIAFKNEKTAPLVQADIEKNNVHMIGSLPGGSNAFITKTEYATLDEMKGLKLGIGMNQSAMEMLGFNVVTIFPNEYYDKLSRGVADAGYMSATALVSMSLQEVTPYFLTDGTYTAGNFITVNLDRWNSLTSEQQKILEDAVAATQQYSFDLANKADEEIAGTIEAANGKLNKLGSEDATRVQAVFFETGVADARVYAQNAGNSDDMEIILQEVANYVGLELPAK